MATGTATIGHVLHRLDRAGAEVLAAGLARALSDRYRFAFLCLDGVGVLGEQLRAEGFPVVALDRRPGLDGRVAGRLRGVARDLGIDLLHAHQYTPFFYSAIARRLSDLPPILFTEHGRHYPDRRRWKRVVVNKLLLRKHDRVTAVGRFVQRALVRNEGIPFERVQVIYNGTELVRPQSASLAGAGLMQQRRESRQRMHVDEHDRVVLQVARFHPVKDHETSLRAFALVAQRVERAKLVLVGDGERRAACQSLAHELGVTDQVVFLGPRADVVELLPGADVFVLSSLSEGVSVTLLEAMAAGRAVCATDVGGNREVVEHGWTGLLSPRQDPAALAIHIAQLLIQPHLRAVMGDRGRARVIERFSVRAMHDRYAGLYARILSGLV